MHLFFEIEASHFFDARKRELKLAVENASKEQLDSQEVFSRELLKRFRVEPLYLHFDDIYLSSREEQIPGELHPKSAFLVDHMRGESFPRQVITFHLPYSGTFELLRCIPNPRVLSAPEVSVTDNEILFDIIDFYSDSERVKRDADQKIDVIKKQSQNLFNNVEEYNTSLLSQIVKIIEQRRDQLQKRSSVVESLGYPVKVPEQSRDRPQKRSSVAESLRSPVKAPKQTTTKDQKIPAVSDFHDEYEWDVFISHASEDKVKFVRELATELKSRGLLVWYDEFTLTIGDSLRKSIDKGLAQSRYGVVVLSPHFFNKDWPQDELNGLFVRERNGEKVILPIWLDVDQDFVAKYSPIIADRVAAKSSDGIEKVISDLLAVIRTISDGVGKKYIDLEGRLIIVEGEAILNFGKYSGRSLKEIAAEAPDYLEWILAMDFSPEVHEIVEKALLGVFPQMS